MQLDNILKRINEYGGKVYCRFGVDGDIEVLNTEHDLYFDRRNVLLDADKDLWAVFPVCLDGRSIWYICPSCGKLHLIDKDSFIHGSLHNSTCAGVKKHSKKRTVLILEKQYKIPVTKYVANMVKPIKIYK